MALLAAIPSFPVLAVRGWAYLLIVVILQLAALGTCLTPIIEVSGDDHLPIGVVHGNVDEFQNGAGHLLAKGVDELLAGSAAMNAYMALVLAMFGTSLSFWEKTRIYS